MFPPKNPKEMMGVLSISGERVSCERVAELMHALGIHGDVTRNVTVLDGQMEPGCRVRVVSDPERKTEVLWNAARREFGLKCAHVKLSKYQSGCVFDVYRSSNCPG